MTRRYLGGLLLALLAGATSAHAQSEPAATLGRPVATLGRPRPLSANPGPEPVRLAAFEPEPPSPAERMIGPALDSPLPFNPADDAFRSAPRGSSETEDFLRGRPAPRPSDDDRKFLHTSNFGEKLMEWFRPGANRECEPRRWFESDHAFDYMISPVGNPFLFEDPRAITEIRPIFMLQTIPNKDANFRGGNAEFYGTQLRVAFTERFSFVMHKLGFIDVNPGDGSTQPGGFGFAEMHFGPKYTFLRSEDNCLVAAGGLIFQVPTGPPRVYQDTGGLSLVPYVSIAKNFLDSRFGSLNVMDTAGFAIATDSHRSDYFYNSLHLDWDVANRHKLYPLMELHWFQYTGSGDARNLGVEGRDLANLGDTGSSGNANLSWGIGFRYKFNEGAQMGLLAEFPLNSRKDLMAFRLGLDFIWRY